MSSMEHIPTACNKVDDDVGDCMMKMIMTMLIIIVMMNKEMLNIVITEVMRGLDDDVDNINDDALDYQPSILLDR